MNRFFYCLILLLSFHSLCFSQEQKLHEIAIPLASEDPGSSFDDISFLAEKFKDKQIISIGEATHGTKEFALMRHKLFKYLVLHHGFNTIFLEDEYSRCLAIDAYIKGKTDANSATLLQNLGNWPWCTEEMQELIEWMKAYNKNHPDQQLSFVGVDMQDGLHMLKTLNNLLHPYNPDNAIEMPEFVKTKTHEKWSKQEAEVYDLEVINKLDHLMNSMTFSKEYLQIILNLKRHLEQYKFDHAECGDKNTACRDFSMGENIIYATQQQPQIKGLFIAHNIHIAQVYHKAKSMKKSFGFAGGVLEDHFKDKHFALAQEFDYGSFNAYYTHKPGSNNKEDYEIMEITIEEAIENSFAEAFRSADCSICYIPMKEVARIKSSEDYIGYKKTYEGHMIGGRFLPAKDNPKQTLEYVQFGDDNFDAFIFFKKSNASGFIKK